MTKETQWGPFIAFSGGKCPVDSGVGVRVIYDNHVDNLNNIYTGVAESMSWGSPYIIGYRVEVKPEKLEFHAYHRQGCGPQFYQGHSTGIKATNYEATLEELEQFKV